VVTSDRQVQALAVNRIDQFVECLSPEIGSLKVVGIVPEQVVTTACANLAEDRRQEILIKLYALNLILHSPI
jgi:hypothetical protein